MESREGVQQIALIELQRVVAADQEFRRSDDVFAVDNAEKAREEGKPDNVVEKIVAGQLSKWASEVALLDQAHVNAEKHDSKTIEELRQELAAKTGENVRIARFSYFRVGDE